MKNGTKGVNENPKTFIIRLGITKPASFGRSIKNDTVSKIRRIIVVKDAAM
jgi:hypothetical protein